jgi:general secretion pathway protein L
MKMNVTSIRSKFSAWIERVAEAVEGLCAPWSKPRVVRLVQQRGDEFFVHSEAKTSAGGTAQRIEMGENASTTLPPEIASAINGNRVELVLNSEQFLFRSIELPCRATEFLPGIVRTQIDRLTPWEADCAAFGWAEPVALGSDRMRITIAATALSLVRPFVDAVTTLAAHSIVVLATFPREDKAAAAIKVLEQRGAQTIAQTRKILTTILIATGIVTATTAIASVITDTILEGYQAEAMDKLKKLRMAAGHELDGSLTSAKRVVERRKYDSPPTVIVLDALSEILPDHTYVTELRIEGNKVRVVGITRDAPSLIDLLEKSGRFIRASFLGATTRNSDGGERFNIEATILPITSVRS